MFGPLPRDEIPTCEAPVARTREPRLLLPPNAVDCHAHVCGPETIYPLSPTRLYSPIGSTVADYRAMLETVGLERAVLVQPSFYGADNSALLDALRQNPSNFRGVAVVHDDINHAELARLDVEGIRGIRFNIVDRRDGKGVFPVKQIKGLARRLADLGWHIELLAHVDDFPELQSFVADLPVGIVFAHFGYPHGAHARESDGFRSFLKLLKAGKAWVKLTGPYRISGSELPYADIAPIVQEVVSVAAGRIVWGSDWPHVRASWPTAMPNDGDLVDLLETWVPDADLRHQILVRNPENLYGFA